MENSPQLAALMEVNGVEVAFALDQNGRLICASGSSLFTPDLLQRASKRIITLMGALSEYLRPATEATLVYEHHLIILRRREDLILAVLAQNNVNLVALKLSGNLCLKSLAEPPPQAAKPAPPSAPASPPAPPARPAGPSQAGGKPPAPSSPKSNTPPKRGSGIWG